MRSERWCSVLCFNTIPTLFLPSENNNLFEGDMILSNEQRLQILGGSETRGSPLPVPLAKWGGAIYHRLGSW